MACSACQSEKTVAKGLCSRCWGKAYRASKPQYRDEHAAYMRKRRAIAFLADQKSKTCSKCETTGVYCQGMCRPCYLRNYRATSDYFKNVVYHRQNKEKETMGPGGPLLCQAFGISREDLIGYILAVRQLSPAKMVGGVYR